MTDWWRFSSLSIAALQQDSQLQQAARRLRAGELVAFPTETVYGLGADATSDQAVEQIFQAKGRPSDNPLIVHVGQVDQVRDWVTELPQEAVTVLQTLCPGPLTLVLSHNGRLSSLVTAGLDSVGIRIPNHPLAQALLRLSSLPIAAPSANLSGRPSPTKAEHVWEDLAGRIDLLLDGGAAGVGVESTVVDFTTQPPTLLRPGGVTVEEIESMIGSVQLPSKEGKPRSPGMKYRHYAPQADLWLVQGTLSRMREQIQRQIEISHAQGRRVGVLTTSEQKQSYPEADMTVVCGSRQDAASVAYHLYESLRRFDQSGVDEIYCESFPETGLYGSVMNRLRKAADGKVLGSP